MSLLQVAKLPFLINDGKWHHLCITWTTRDGMWEAFQDGVMRGNGENLAPYHPIKPEGVLVLGQEQVDIYIYFQISDCDFCTSPNPPTQCMPIMHFILDKD